MILATAGLRKNYPVAEPKGLSHKAFSALDPDASLHPVVKLCGEFGHLMVRPAVCDCDHGCCLVAWEASFWKQKGFRPTGSAKAFLRPW
jgi:hypothetical protein